MNYKFDVYPHVWRAQQFSRVWLEKCFFPMIDRMKTIVDEGGCDILRGKRMVSLFYEPSTRTRASHQIAFDYLNGRTVFSTENAREFSSGAKGESLEHTIKVLNRYRPDVIVLRYDRKIGAELAVSVSKAAIINAGDRNPGHHPTQALLDIRTIKKCLGRVDGISIAMVGDLKNGRTVRSLSYLFGKFKNVSISFVSPKKSQMKNDVKLYLEKNKVRFSEVTDLRKLAGSVDVIYQTRTQKECGASIDRNNYKLGYFIVDKKHCGHDEKRCNHYASVAD